MPDNKDELVIGVKVDLNDYPFVQERIDLKVRNQLKSLKAKIESEKLERPESGPNRNGTAQAVRAAHNKALSKVNKILDELIGEK